MLLYDFYPRIYYCALTSTYQWVYGQKLATYWHAILASLKKKKLLLIHTQLNAVSKAFHEHKDHWSGSVRNSPACFCSCFIFSRSNLSAGPVLKRPRRPTHFSLDHVDPTGAQCLHAVVDVHHSFTFGHIQHDVQHDVAASPAGAHAVTGQNRAEERRRGRTWAAAHCSKWENP